MMVLCHFQPINAQIPLDSLFSTPTRTVKAPKNCTDIEIDQEGNLLLLSSSQHRIHKVFRNTEFDSVLTIGGKGIGREGFNMPVKIQSPNRQNIYVLDYQNRRLALLNVNLKLSQDINFLTLPLDLLGDSETFLFVESFAVGPTGEIYLLNQENNKIYKYNNFQRLETVFGGLDYGAGSLLAPEDLHTDEANFIFASDPENQKVTVFDFYGIFKYNLELRVPFRWKRTAVIGTYLVYFDEHNLFFYNLTSKKIRHIPFPDTMSIIDIDGNKEFFTLLAENGVHLYSLKPKKSK